MSLQLENNGGYVQVPRTLMQAFLHQDPNHPGVETVRLPTTSSPEDQGTTTTTTTVSGTSAAVPNFCREVETEVCLVCRRCGRAYPQESMLLAHQRSCYLGNQQSRGALRLVQTRYSCSLCDTNSSTRTYGSITEWRRHSETLQHRTRYEQQQQQQQQQRQQSMNQTITGGNGGKLVTPTIDRDARSPNGGQEANPLIDEMEDVVNQITLLAARAAAESTKIGGSQSSQNPSGLIINNQDNNNGPESKRQKHIQEIAAIAGGR